MSETAPELSRQETIARLAAEAAAGSLPDYGEQIAALQQQLAELPARLRRESAAAIAQLPDYSEQIETLRQQLASVPLLVANLAQQLTALELKYDQERETRIAGDAELRRQFAADVALLKMTGAN